VKQPTTIDDVATALELIAARVPDRHVTPDRVMAVSWLADLERFDRSVVLRASREWNGLRFPAVAEFVDWCGSVAQTIAAEEARALSSGELVTTACAGGCDEGWVWASTAGHGEVRPCSVCCAVEFAMFEHRRLDPAHDEDRCRECAGLRARTKVEPLWLADARERAAARGRSPLASNAF
jgi:hypothetical protein